MQVKKIFQDKKYLSKLFCTFKNNPRCTYNYEKKIKHHHKLSAQSKIEEKKKHTKEYRIMSSIKTCMNEGVDLIIRLHIKMRTKFYIALNFRKYF